MSVEEIIYENKPEFILNDIIFTINQNRPITTGEIAEIYVREWLEACRELNTDIDYFKKILIDKFEINESETGGYRFQNNNGGRIWLETDALFEYESRIYLAEVKAGNIKGDFYKRYKRKNGLCIDDKLVQGNRAFQEKTGFVLFYNTRKNANINMMKDKKKNLGGRMITVGFEFEEREARDYEEYHNNTLKKYYSGTINFN